MLVGNWQQKLTLLWYGLPLRIFFADWWVCKGRKYEQSVAIKAISYDHPWVLSLSPRVTPWSLAMLRPLNRCLIPPPPPRPTGRPVAAFPLSVYLSFAPSSLLSLFFPPGSSCRPCSPPPLAVRQTKHQTCIKSIFQKQNIRDYHARRRSTNKRNKASWLFFSLQPTHQHPSPNCLFQSSKGIYQSRSY